MTFPLKSPLGILYILSQVYEIVYTYLHEYFSVCFAFTNLLQSASHKIINLALVSPSGIKVLVEKRDKVGVSLVMKHIRFFQLG